MKKVKIILLILIVLGTAGFFMGWTHLTVPPGSYGVLRTKSHGLESEIIQDGEFKWLWYKMLPTNAEVHVFNIDTVRRNLRSRGTLSSGDVYSSLAGLEADFSWDLSADLRFSIRPEILPELVRRERIKNNSDLRLLEEELAFRMETMILSRLRAFADSDNETAMENLGFSGYIPELNREIEMAFPEIENLYCIFRIGLLPDYALYRSMRGLYRDYLEQQSFVLRQDVLRDAQKRIETRIRLDELAQYGDLLTRYPILLDYLALENNINPLSN